MDLAPHRLAALSLLVTLAACGGPRIGPPAPVETRQVVRPPAPTLAQREQRLTNAYRGKPVDVTFQRDGSLRLEAPLRFCFDLGRADVKPECAQAIDRLAGNGPFDGKQIRITAPTDSPTAKSLVLATDRASSIRDRLEGHGMQDAEISLAAVAHGGVTIVVSDAPGRAARL